jgi:misacylated tRNA(Ala) deacylase
MHQKERKMTKELFREDGYLKQCTAIVTGIQDGHIIVDQTVFYPVGGGQPGDSGMMRRPDNSEIKIINTIKDRESGEILHQVEGDTLPEMGEQLALTIDWDRRYQIMRLHSCMHMLCAVIPAPVTGGSIRDDGTARLDFDLPEPPDKLAIEQKLNEYTTTDHAMSLQWISDAEMEAQAELIRTMSVKPPMGQGKVRLVNFAGVDLQPCGGTHVGNSNEIGPVRVKKIEKKGKQNRRIIIQLAE